MQEYVFFGSLVSSLLIYGIVYWQLRCSFSNLLGNAFQKMVMSSCTTTALTESVEPSHPSPHGTLYTEQQGYVRLFNVVYFLFVVNGLVMVAKKVTSLQIKNFTLAIQIWSDITSSQLFWLGCFAVLYVVALLVIKERLQDALNSSPSADSPPW